jgi:RNA polymerase sigma-70 factor (ECF subfamily)
MKATLIPLHRPAGGTQALSDEALLAACSARDPAALGALFDRYQKDVYRVLGRLAGADRDDRDDLVQTTFLEAYRSASSFAGGASAKAWLMGIAVNVVRHHVRGEARRRSLFSLFAREAPAAAPAPELEVSREQLRRRLQAAIDALPYDLRAVYVMCAVEEVAGPEAALALGLREGTLYRRLHEARQALKAALEEGTR